MKTKEADWPNNASTDALPPRERVLEVACELFSEAGFHGTHFREICKRAGTNVAGICYHFHSKKGLYQAVLMEAGRRLSEGCEGLVISNRVPPQQRLLNLIGSLLQRLSVRRAWIAKLLARELVDVPCGEHTYVASGLERDFVLLQAVMRDLLGADISSESVRFHALSVICECVIYSLMGDNPCHPLAQLAMGLPGPSLLAPRLAERFLQAVQAQGATPEASSINMKIPRFL